MISEPSSELNNGDHPSWQDWALSSPTCTQCCWSLLWELEGSLKTSSVTSSDTETAGLLEVLCLDPRASFSLQVSHCLSISLPTERWSKLGSWWHRLCFLMAILQSYLSIQETPRSYETRCLWKWVLLDVNKHIQRHESDRRTTDGKTAI